MNIKLSLLITLAVLGGNMNAETIRERLIRERQVANRQGEHKQKSLEKEVNGLRPDQINENLKAEFKEAYGLALRAELLQKMVTCMDLYRSTLETEHITADMCFTKLSDILNNPNQRYMDKTEKELTLKELEKIGQEVLNRS